MCCGARVPCSLHRPCLVPFLALLQYDRTAFHYAAAKGHVAAMELLVASGLDGPYLNARDKVRAPLGSLMTAGKGERE